MTAAKEQISYLNGYMGVTEKIKRAMYDVAKQFVYIGFLLWEVKEYGYYREGGYKDVYDYAQQELGFKKSSVKNFIAICEQFGTADHRQIGGAAHVRTMSIQQKYEKFNYSQLCEMLAMSEKQRDQAKPDMTVKQLRQLKKLPEVEQMTMDQLETTGQTSGQSLEHKSMVVNNYWRDDIDPETVKLLCKAAGIKFNPKSCYNIKIELHKG